MSFDFALAKVCEHRVFNEYLTLDPYSRNTLKFIRPPLNNNVELSMDGVDVPKEGLRSEVEWVSTKHPFRIYKGKNDLLLIKVGSQPAIQFQLPADRNWNAKNAESFFNKRIPGVNVSEKNGRLSFSSSDGTSFSFPDPREFDRNLINPDTKRILQTYQVFGIRPGRVFTSKVIVPGWGIVSNPNSYVDEVAIVFEKPILNANPIFEVSYFTKSQDCRRCSGSDIEYDYSIIGGEFERISNLDLMVQEFDKFLFTRRGSHWKWDWLGSRITDRIGGKANAPGNSASAMIQLDVQQAFQNYQNIKLQQDKVGFQRVSDAEFPLSISSLKVDPYENDPTIVTVQLEVRSRSADPIEITRVVEGPNSYFISGNSTSFRLRA